MRCLLIIFITTIIIMKGTINLLSNMHYMHFLLIKNKASWNDYKTFYEVQFSKQALYNNQLIDKDLLCPYFFTLNLQKKKDIDMFNIYFNTYLRNSELWNNEYNINVMDVLKCKYDIDILVPCILSMQYFYL